MNVLSTFGEVEVKSVAEGDFVLASAKSHARGVGLVRVAEVNAVETTAYEPCHGVLRTVA